MLVKLSDYVREMQEERGRRRVERGKSLGASLGGGAGGGEGALVRRLEGGARMTIPTATIDVDSQDRKRTTSAIDPDNPSQSQSEGEGRVILTPLQMQQFSSENSALLTSMSSTLTTVLRAESSLLEISQLQSTLISHLATQGEMIDLLYDEAVGTVADLGRANEQLRKARERGREGRMWLVIFLGVATMALVFLDWYS